MANLNSLDSLPEFGENYLQYFDPYEKSFQLRRKSTNEGGISLNGAMELIPRLMKKYQLSYVTNRVDKTLILFPFMFKQPNPGDKIRNITTGEVYTIKQVIINPDTKNWDGLLKLDLINPPNIQLSHALEHINIDNYVRFNHEFPDELPNQVGANLERILRDPPPISPIVTWTVVRVEPGSVGQVFDSRKEYKKRLRESVKDPFVPGHTVEIMGQWFDNIVQFDCWSGDHRTSYRLVRWFEQFLQLYTEYIRRCGIVNMFFWQRTNEGMNNAWRQAFPIRSTQFYFRTEELEAVYQRDILRMNISVEVSSSDPKPLSDNETRFIADQRVSGSITQDEYRALYYRSGQYLFGDIELKQ